MSRKQRRQSKTDAALVQSVATMAAQLAELTRRMSPEVAARGTPLPPHIVNPPRQQRTPQLDQAAVKGDVNMGIPSQQMMNQMLTNQAPQEGAVGIYAPGAPLQVVPGIESPLGPRIWDYPYGYNIASLPRSTERTSFQELRDLADLYYGIRLCERVWFDVLNRLDAKITLKPGVIPDGESDTDPKWQKIIQPAADFIACPDGHHSLSDWLIMSCGDVLELGQSIIYKARNKKGDIIRLDVIDAALVKPLINQRGLLSDPPYPAFQQFIKGIPAGLYPGEAEYDPTQPSWTTSQMHLITEMERTNSIYARSRVEEILLTINQALRLQNLNLTRYTDGATPEGMVFIDDTDGSWTIDKVDEIERFLNGLLAGNDRLRARLKVMPPGLKDYQETRMDDPKTDFELWLLKITCAAFGVTPAELGITDDVNRATGDSQENVIYRRVVQPLARRYGAFLTSVIQETFDKRLILTWTGIEEREDELQKAQMLQIGVQTGAISPSTMARLMGWPVEQEVEPFVMFNGGPSAVIPTSAIATIAKEVAQTLQTQAQQAQAALENTKLQGQQTQATIQMMQQRQEQQGGEDQGEAGEEGEGEPNGPEGPGGGGGGAASGAEGEEPEEESPEENEGEASEGGEQGQGESESDASDEGEGNDEEAGPDAEAEAEVNRLIAQAKAAAAAKGKGKQQRMQVADADVSDEWRRYRKVALRAVERHVPVPTFTSDVLPANFHAYAADALSRAQTPDDVRQVFADVREAEMHAEDCRCLVCGCGEPLNDHGMPYTVAGTAGNLPGDEPTYPITVPPIDDCYVALYLPAHVGQPLADLVGRDTTEPRDLHVHLAALGREGDVDVDALCQVVQSWATSQHPIVARIPGYGRMPNALDGSCDAATAIVESPALVTVRQDLVTTLRGAGLSVQDADTFRPQIELAYFSPGSDFPEPLTHVPTNGADFTLPYVWVVAGLRRWAYPLGGGADERAVVVDELRALRSEVTQAMAADYVRWAEHEIVRGAGGKIIGNIYDGHFEPAPGVTHEHVRDALAIHAKGSTKYTAMESYLNQNTPIPGGKFIARQTSTPHEDIQRNWSGWKGSSATTKADAIDNFLAQQDEDYFDPQPYYDKWQAQQGVPEGQRKEWDRDTNEPAFTEWLGKQRGIDARYNPSAKRWVIVDHEGLSGFHIDAADEQSAASSAKEEFLDGGRPRWEGDSTVGRVRHVANLGNNWHLFQSEDVIPEEEKRHREARGDYGSDVVPSVQKSDAPTAE